MTATSHLVSKVAFFCFYFLFGWNYALFLQICQVVRIYYQIIYLILAKIYGVFFQKH